MRGACEVKAWEMQNAYEIANTKPQLKKVYIGHIFENHYVPIDEITDSVEDSSIKTYK